VAGEPGVVHLSRRERKAAALSAALDAAAAASTGVLELQSALDILAIDIAYAGLDDTPEARGLPRRLAELQTSADALREEQLRVAATRPVGPDRSTAELLDAAHDLTATAGRLVAAQADVQRLAARCAGPRARVDAQLARVREPLVRAREHLTRVLADRDAAAADGLSDPDVDVLLVRAGDALTAAQADASSLVHAHRVERAAATATAALSSAGNTLTGLRLLQRELAPRTAAARTRVEVLLGRLPAADDALHALRREHPASAFADVEGAPARARTLLAAATVDLDASAGRPLREAGAQVDAARRRLAEAAPLVDAPVERLALLHRVAADDPLRAVETAGFALRDVQRLLVQQPGHPDPATVRRLDALVDRLQHARSVLAHPHPDLYDVSTTLDAVHAGVQEVVTAVRQALRQGLR